MSCNLLDPQWSRMTKSLSSSGVSSCYSEMDMDSLYETDADDEDAFISFTTTESKCELLYQEGLELKYCGDYESSLKSFQKCLEGMQECQYFMKLPQTLQRLSELSHFLQDYQGAEEYQKAEKLFYEATEVQSSPTSSKEGRHKKRKPFSKKPKPAMSMSNPAEYGNMLIRKAEELDRLSKACAEKHKFSDAVELCSKAVSIRQCVFGRNHHSTLASMDSLRTLHEEASIHETDRHYPPSTVEELKGDLSMTEQSAIRNENGSSTSAECGGAQALLLATVSNNGIPQCSQNNATQLLPAKDSSTQTDNTFPLAGHYGLLALQGDNTQRRDFPSLYSSSPCKVTEDVDTSDKEERQECAYDGIHKDTRQDKEALLNGVEGKSQDTVPVGGVKTNFSKLSELKNPMCVGGMKTNLGKLSELKNPMCVDLHKGPGGGTENTRCLPLWILLLPALLALIGYYTFYYH